MRFFVIVLGFFFVSLSSYANGRVRLRCDSEDEFDGGRHSFLLDLERNEDDCKLGADSLQAYKNYSYRLVGDCKFESLLGQKDKDDKSTEVYRVHVGVNEINDFYHKKVDNAPYSAEQVNLIYAPKAGNHGLGQAAGFVTTRKALSFRVRCSEDK